MAGGIDRIAMNGDEREAAFLKEAQRMEIIIRCDQPEPLAACFSCRLRDCLDQQRAYTDPRLCADDSHDLTILIFKRVREQSYPVTFQDGDEAGQRMWMIDLAVSDDNSIAPVFDDTLPYPFAVFGGKRSQLQRKAFDSKVDQSSGASGLISEQYPNHQLLDFAGVHNFMVHSRIPK